MYEAYQNCTLCPRRCGVDRTRGERGFCGADATLHAGRAAPHYYEEPCLSGERGSGAVFFAHCNLRCSYCQNRAISRGGGEPLSEEELADTFLRLEREGVHNLNLVTPTHYLPGIRAALRLARERGLSLPVVYNCGGYERAEVIGALGDEIDVFLPDFKYWDGALAEKFSGAPDYRERATEALRTMVDAAGRPRYDDKGMLTRGVVVRHLMLPGGLEDTKRVLELLWSEFGNTVLLSLMNQFTPQPSCPELGRAVSSSEYDRAVDYAIDLGFEEGYVQEEGTVSESFIPAFDGTGLRE